ncbi:AAA family ATPase, partial [Roseivivax isoporae]
MKLRAIALNNVRRFTAPARLDGIGDGLNVLCEPNERGKSTLFDALQALFFAPHGSRAQEVKALQPHAGGAPEVSVDVETPEGRFTLAKRWLSKPAATVHRDGRLVAQADAAEAWIADLLGGGDGSPAGLVWVRQGMTGFAGGSRKDQEAALAARRDLMSSVGHEVEAMTGGRRMDAALARARSELGELVTPTGRPRVGGPLKAAQDRVAAATERRDALDATAHALHDALDTRRRLRRDLAEIEAPDAAETRRRRLAEATAAHAAAQRHAEAVEAEARKVEAARLTLVGAQGKLETLRATLAEQRGAAQEAAGAEEAATRAAADRESARVAMGTAEAALDAA